MARARSLGSIEAEKLYREGMKLVDIAKKIGVPDSTVRRWKSTQKWDAGKNEQGKKKETERSDKRKPNARKSKGAPKGNKNAVGHAPSVPVKNKNAETHGFFSKYLPEETFSIIQEISKKDPLDILWENIEIAYAAIVRAQRISYVKNNKDNTIIKSGYKNGNVIGEDYLVQTAIDKQSKFMQAQARAQGELRSLIKQYDEMLHKNWELATEEQKARIAALKAKTNNDDPEEIADDGFLEALNGTARDDWSDEE
ncbi:MAG: terminase [Lachnospiraceae bacterium]|nr:terminase [Lachnospiraceae bacterium]